MLALSWKVKIRFKQMISYFRDFQNFMAYANNNQQNYGVLLGLGLVKQNTVHSLTYFLTTFVWFEVILHSLYRKFLYTIRDSIQNLTFLVGLYSSEDCIREGTLFFSSVNVYHFFTFSAKFLTIFSEFVRNLSVLNWTQWIKQFVTK